MDLAKATAAPQVFIAANGREYRLRPMTLENLAEAISWVRVEPVRDIQRSDQFAEFPEAVQRALLADAFEFGRKMPERECMRMLWASFRGVRKLFRIAARQEHGELSEEAVAAAVPAEGFSSVAIFLMGLNDDRSAEERERDEADKVESSKAGLATSEGAGPARPTGAAKAAA